MSISRLMLRSLACVALQQQDDDATPPTMAEDRVFDSRLDPAVFEQTASEIPAIIVYTDADDGTVQNRGNHGGPYLRTVNLRVEIIVGTFETQIVDGVANVGFAVPTTDAELEAKLDVFEQQVRWALMKLPGRSYTNAFLSFVRMIEEIKSDVIRDEGGSNKFATRRITFTCVVPDDCPPQVGLLAPGQVAPARGPVDFSNFPSPWLREPLTVFAQTPAMRNVLDQLSGSGNPVAYLPLLKRLGWQVDAVKPEADPNILATQGKTQGPDGRIEVEGIWQTGQG